MKIYAAAPDFNQARELRQCPAAEQRWLTCSTATALDLQSSSARRSTRTTARQQCQ